jgi:hypothetical protein
MQHGCVLGAVVALSIGPAARAQPPPSNPISPAPAETAPAGEQSDVGAVAPDFRPGMVVRDPSGATIGPITRVAQTADGAAAVEVDLDGRRVSLSPSILMLKPSGDGVLSSMTKAEIRAAAARSPG